MVAGLRTATVWVVGTATLSTPVGAPSLGNYIFSGLQTRNYTAVLVGCVAAALLAIALDQLVALLESSARQRRRGRTRVAAGALLALVLYAGGSLLSEVFARPARRVEIGTKAFTEQYILGELLAEELARTSGVVTHQIPSLGSTVAFDALRSDEIDLYVDYSGTIWATIMKRQGRPPSRAQVLAEVRDFLLEKHGIQLVASLGFENTYALAMRRSHARELGLERIGQLTRHAPSLRMGGDLEFFARAEWRALAQVYGLRFAENRTMDPGLMYQAVASGQVDVISAFSTDGRIAALDLVPLEDDLAVIPPYDAVLLASPGLQRDLPEVVRGLAGLAGRIDADAMRRMNAAVDREGRTPADVAREFLTAN